MRHHVRQHDLQPPGLLSGGRRDGVLWICLLAGAALLRFWALGRQGLWVDEAYTSLITRGGLDSLFAALRADDAPPLYYLLQKPFLDLFGRTETTLRFLSALSGTLFPAALGWAGWMVSRRTGWIAALLGTFSVVSVFYSQQARSYSLVLLLSALLLGCALRLRGRASFRLGASFWALSMGLLYLHNLGILVVLAGYLVIAISMFRSPAGRKPLLCLSSALILGSIPWLAALLGQASVHAQYNEWMRMWWDSGRPLLLGPLYSWGVFLNGSASWFSPPVPLPALVGAGRLLLWPLALLALYGMVAAVAWSAGDRRSATGGSTGRDSAQAGLTAALSFALVPTAGLVLISLLVGPAYVLGRTDAAALPGFLLLLAMGWARLRPAWLGPAAAGVWIAAGLLALLVSPGNPKGSDRDLAQALGREVGGKDALVFSGLTRPTLEHYGFQEGWWDRLEWAGAFPAALDANPAGLVPMPLDSAQTFLRQALELRQTWEEAGIERVWILAVRSLDPEEAEDRRLRAVWPRLPRPPHPDRSLVGAAQVTFPTNVMVAALAGLRPVESRFEYTQDWVSGARMVLCIPARSWVRPDSVPSLEVRP